jgi:hypothetical protein
VRDETPGPASAVAAAITAATSANSSNKAGVSCSILTHGVYLILITSQASAVTSDVLSNQLS